MNKTYWWALVAAIMSGCFNEPVQRNEPYGAGVVVNEFMADNETDSIIDQFNEAEDWVELFNGSNAAMTMEGLYLSDDSTRLDKYALADTVIESKGYYVIWLDEQAEQGDNHANFKISAQNGEELILSDSHGTIIDRIRFFASSGNPEARLPGVSYGRSVDGGDQWIKQAAPTPGKSNGI
jgi:hypothetical protein